MPRARKLPPPLPEKVGDLAVHPRVTQVFEKYGDPLEKMAQMAQELEDSFAEDALSTRARLLSELAAYGYAKFKGRDADNHQQAQKVEINIVGLAEKLVPES